MSIKMMSLDGLDYLKTVYPIDNVACDITPQDSITPPQEILAIIKKEGQTWLDKFHWGFVPYWANDITVGQRMINARAETLAQKPSFRHAFKKQRCLILAEGFYEWKVEKNIKKPVLVTLPDSEPFAFAGLWDIWKKAGTVEFSYKSCTIITTRASASIRKVHHRMPVVLQPEMYASWLDPDNQNGAALKHILKEGILTEFVCYPTTPGHRSDRHQLSLFD